MNTPPLLRRRTLLAATAALPASALWAADADTEALLRAGGVVIVIRHALAPGTFDPPGFRIGECSTQRNLNDEGRAQARRIGEWFRTRQLKPTLVRSSPWCRCVDTATLAFGAHEVAPVLGSPRGYSEATNAESLQTMRRDLAAVSARRAGFEAWVTHNFVLNALVGGSASSGEGLVMRADASGAPQVLARLAIS